MLKLYDSSGAFLRMLPDTDYTDLTVVSTLQDGDKELSFTYLGKPSTIRNEYYIETDSDRYTVKEIHPGDHGTQIVCKLNLEDLEQEIYQIFTAQDVTAAAAAALALTGTGWTVSSTLTKERSVQCIKKTPLEILYKIRDAFMCEIYFDTAAKVVTLADQLGQDRGVYLRTDLNLQSLSPVLDSYDYYTRLIPIGADGLEIDNDGKNYVEDYSYSSKVRTLIWEDTSYTDADALQADAQAKLADLAKPKRSYSADVIDFAKITGDSTLAFSLGDTIKITDEPTGTMERQRIVKITEHPDEPGKNSVELSNTVLTWEEMQARYQAAAQAWEDISNQDGSVNGVYVHGVQGDDVVGVEVVTGGSRIRTNLNSAMSAVQTDITNQLQAVSARIGTIETTYLTATLANLDTANITTAKVRDLFVQVGLVKDAVISGARITGYLDAVEVNANNITAGTLNAGLVDVVNLNADNINTGSINGQRIADGAISALKLTQELNDTIESSVADTQILYALSDSTSIAPSSGWSETAPDWEEGKYMWQQTVLTHVDGTVETKPATCISGAAGQAGEDASILRIDSSNGTVFKNSNFGTTFTVVIWKGPREIKDITALRSVYGNGAYLEWKWKRLADEEFHVISVSDSRISRNGFQFEISPEDVDEKIVFQCDLIV